MSNAHGTDAPLMVSVSGLRGIVGASLTTDVINRYAHAYAAETRDRSGVARPMVVLGRDGRAGGQPIHAATAAALSAAGCQVIDLDIATTPTVGVMVLHRRAQAGLVVTASHNPAQWNGLKPITDEGAAPSPEDARRLVKRFESIQVPAPVAGPTQIDRDTSASGIHVSRVLKACERIDGFTSISARRPRVVLDSVNASGRIGGRKLLTTIGCDLVHINCDESGAFPHNPEPLAENLTGLCDEVKKQRADIGLAQDPDADRLAIVDERGVFIGEEYTLALAAYSLLSGLSTNSAWSMPRRTLAANLSTSRMLDDVAAKFGADVVRTPVGEANVVAGMRRTGAVLGGEGNGGVIWPPVVPIRDSLVAMGLVLTLMCRTGKMLSELVSQMPSYAIEKRKLTLGDASAVAAAQSAVLKEFQGSRIDQQDGIRADLNLPTGGAGWVHARASNTEPIFRLIAEAPTREAAAALLDRAQAAISGRG